MKSSRSCCGNALPYARSRQGGKFLLISKLSCFGDFDEGVLVRRMQPAAADVEGDVGRRLDRMRPPADAVARFQHDGGEAGVLQRIRGAEARGAGADDGDVD